LFESVIDIGLRRGDGHQEGVDNEAKEY
jgi:hypothetical protein